MRRAGCWVFGHLLIGAVAAFAQAQLTLSGPATARPGQSVAVTVSHNAAGASGFQWTATYPAGWTVDRALTAAAAAAASKTLQASTDSRIALVYGMNQNVIQTGALAVITLAVPAAAAPGPASITLSGAVAATAQAVPIPISAGPALAIAVLAREDLNGDGKIDQADLAIAADAATGRAACGSADINNDGKCDLIDALLVIKAALGI